MSQVLVLIILYFASHTGISEQAVLSCNNTNEDASISELSEFQSDVRVVDGFSSSSLKFYGSAQNLSVLLVNDRSTFTTELGVCYSTSTLGCYKLNIVEDCDNFVRGVIDLDGDCTKSNCRVLVCGTNALLARCSFCTLNDTGLFCDFVENNPPQNLPYNAPEDSSYSSCSNDNIEGDEIFQFRRDDNATFSYEDGKIYFGLLKSDNEKNSIIGLASINGTTGEISGQITTRTDSQKVVATEAHFMDKPFISGDYVYFLFREPSQEFASLSQGQTPRIDKYYSRIARICKDDPGVTVSSAKILTSFLKQRLVCSLVDENEVLEFNEIQDFERVDETIHAIFTSARNDRPHSALCVFNLTKIDETFNIGNFFGAHGGIANDRWKSNEGKRSDQTTVSPRPGFDCSTPNTADTNFQRDFNLMADPAVQTNEVPIFLEGDRFSKLSLNGSDYIIASERGCLYRVPVVSDVKDLGEPCEVPLVAAPIEDMEAASSALLLTANDDVFMYDDTCLVELLDTDTVNPSPPPDSYIARPNSIFSIIYSPTTSGSPVIHVTTEEGMEVIDSNNMAHLLIKNESLDVDNTVLHLDILILYNTTVQFSNSLNVDYSITTYANYTCGELQERIDVWNYTSVASGHLNDSCGTDTDSSFDSSVLLDNGLVQDCHTCTYQGCTDQCPP